MRPAHRTLRALYDESFARLDDDERIVFRRMSCVAAPWSADALVAVCADEDTAPSRALAALWRLVEKSLVTSESDGERARYRLLESSREYAAERLAEAGDAEVTLVRHCAFFLARAEHAERVFLRDGEPAWEVLARAWAAERDHVAFALDRAIGDPARIDVAIAFVLAGRRIWGRFGPFADVARLIRRCLAAMPPDADPVLHGRVWSALCDMEVTRSHYDAAADAAEHAIALLRGRAPVQLARVYVHYLGLLTNAKDPRAELVRPEAIAAARASGDESSIWYLLVSDGLLELDRVAGDLDLAEAKFTEALATAERMQRRLYVAVTRGYLARTSGRRGRFALAVEACRDVIRTLRELSAHIFLSDLLVQTAWFSRECGAFADACALAVEAVALRSQYENDSLGLAALDEYAAALNALGESERAALLRGYTDYRGALAGDRMRFDEHVVRHAPLGARLRAAHPAAYARGERAGPDEIAAALAATS